MGAKRRGEHEKHDLVGDKEGTRGGDTSHPCKGCSSIAKGWQTKPLEAKGWDRQQYYCSAAATNKMP